MLETEHVFLDTEVFVRHNFSYGSKNFRALCELVNEGKITLYVTEITRSEVSQKIRDRVADAKRALAPVRAISTSPNALILRNVQHLGFSGVFTFDETALIAEIEKQFADFLQECSVQIVPTADLLAGPILEKYFRGEAPFEKREEKKNEFPDAFNVAVMSTWCVTSHTKAYAISADKGFRSACALNPGLIPLKSVTDLTDIVARATAPQVDLALEWFRLAVDHIRKEVADGFEWLGFILTDQDGDVNGVTVAQEDVQLGEPEFLSVEEGQASLSLQATVPYTAEVSYDDPGATYWIEGDKYVMDTVTTDIDREDRITVYVDLTFNPVVAPPAPSSDRSAEVDFRVLVSVSLGTSDIEVVVHDTADDWYH